MHIILQTIDGYLAAGQPVYVHCYGGIGRTGTVVGCHLVQQGATGAAALAEIARRRQGTPDGYRQSPETEEQRRLVLAWRAG
jgi:protein-tyrosine phosphatase